MAVVGTRAAAPPRPPRRGAADRRRSRRPSCIYDSGYWLPFGGGSPGPRFLIPMLPFLAVGLACAWRRFPATTLALAVPSARRDARRDRQLPADRHRPGERVDAAHRRRQLPAHARQRAGRRQRLVGHRAGARRGGARRRARRAGHRRAAGAPRPAARRRRRSAPGRCSPPSLSGDLGEHWIGGVGVAPGTINHSGLPDALVSMRRGRRRRRRWSVAARRASGCASARQPVGDEPLGHRPGEPQAVHGT